MNKYQKRISGLLAAAMVIGVLFSSAPVRAYASQVDDWRDQLADTQAELNDLNDKIEAVEKKKDSAMDAKALLDERNDVLTRQIRTVKGEIEDTTQRIEENEAEEEKQYALFCKQVRQEEERGPVSYWSVLFNATDFADLLSRIDFINEIMEHDQRVIDELQTLRTQLKQDREALEEQKTLLADNQAELESEIAEAAALVKDLASTQEGYEAQAAEKEAQAEKWKDKIQQEQNKPRPNPQPDKPADTSSRQAILDGIIWPSNHTRYITSLFGWRVHPIWGTTRYHSGLDIAVPYGTDVMAAQGGTVLEADGGWNGGYGKCVIIDHGHGVATLYAHMSGLAVSAGQTVSRGQVIGYCGSTGNSTGPHIHFEVRLDGDPVDPLPYLDNNYIPYWDD